MQSLFKLPNTKLIILGFATLLMGTACSTEESATPKSAKYATQVSVKDLPSNSANATPAGCSNLKLKGDDDDDEGEDDDDKIVVVKPPVATPVATPAATPAPAVNNGAVGGGIVASGGGAGVLTGRPDTSSSSGTVTPIPGTTPSTCR